MTIKGRVHGKTIELTRALPYPDGQELTLQVIPPANGAPAGSPRALLDAIRHAQPVDSTIVDEFDRAIEAGRVAVRFRGTFDVNAGQ